MCLFFNRDVVLSSDYFEIRKTEATKKERYTDEWKAIDVSHECIVADEVFRNITIGEIPMPLGILQNKNSAMAKEYKILMDAFIFALRTAYPFHAYKNMNVFIKTNLARKEVEVENTSTSTAKKLITRGNKATECYLSCCVKNFTTSEVFFDSEVSFINEVPDLGKSLEIWTKQLLEKSSQNS